MSFNERITLAKEQLVNSIKNININTDNAQYFETNSKYEDLKKFLESDSEKDKLDAMKRLVAAISKGRNVSALFPSVVKNVVTKNIDLKKLVYMYLVHYAEVEPDSALLAINSFQKDLVNSNQYIRASALRVMSSIRVKIIVPLIVLAIQKATKDISPYVRKTAAHAISKVNSLDQERSHRDELLEILKTLLADRSIMVLGSTITAWSEICPDRFDLIHPHFRKLCHLLADIDEWGQIVILNMFVRYGRTQFENPDKTSPRKAKTKKKGLKVKHGSESGSDADSIESEPEAVHEDFGSCSIDPDLRLLLDSAFPLLKSRNTGVVLAVASLYFFLAPSAECGKVTKALVRISRGKREVEYVVLANLVTMAASRPQMFQPYLSEFFILPSDASYCRNMKLELITLLVNQENIHKVLKEFRSYISREEKDFVAATIEAIGRCAASVPEVTDRCLHGLMSLLNSHSPLVVAESVIVIKRLLQMLTESEEHENMLKDVIIHLSKLLEHIETASARASIIWLIGEYCDKVPLIAPDTLRKLAKTFIAEDPSVKLQILYLAAKVVLENPQQTRKLFNYVTTLAKYDQNYDIRDQCRLLRILLGGSQSGNASNDECSLKNVRDHLNRLLQTKKPIPTLSTPSEGRKRFLLGSLSHLVNHSVRGYEPLADFPDQAPDKHVRDEPIVESTDGIHGTFANEGHTNKGGEQAFWSEEEEEEDNDENNDSRSSYSSYSDEERPGSDSRSGSEGSYSSGSRSFSEDSGSDLENEESPNVETIPRAPNKEVQRTTAKVGPKIPVKQHSDSGMSKSEISSRSKQSKSSSSPSLEDLFQDLSTISSGNINTLPSLKDNNNDKRASSIDDLFNSVSLSGGSKGNSSFLLSSSPSSSFSHEISKLVLLKSALGGGLGVEYSYVRAPSMIGASVKSLILYFKNFSNKPIKEICMRKIIVSEGTEVIPFPTIDLLNPGEMLEFQMSVKFNSVSQPVKFAISTNQGEYLVSITPPIGELIRPSSLTLEEFSELERKLKGMNEAVDHVTLTDIDGQSESIHRRILDCAYLSTVEDDIEEGKLRFSGRTMTDDVPLLFSVDIDKSAAKARLTVNCENTVLSSMLLKHLKKAISL